MEQKTNSLHPTTRGKTPRKDVTMDRRAFWKYCKQCAAFAEGRARKVGVPYAITAYDIDELLVQQQWRCALSGLPLAAPGNCKKRNPLGPSLDRIVPSLGYVPGNVRVVCTMANLALNEFGLEAVMQLFDAIREHQAQLA